MTLVAATRPIGGVRQGEIVAALERKPAFALMLMSLMIGRLRDTIARLTVSGALTQQEEVKQSAAFDPERITELVNGLSDDPPVYYQRGQQIMSEGQRALRMYAVIEAKSRSRSAAGWSSASAPAALSAKPRSSTSPRAWRTRSPRPTAGSCPSPARRS